MSVTPVFPPTDLWYRRLVLWHGMSCSNAAVDASVGHIPQHQQRDSVVGAVVCDATSTMRQQSAHWPMVQTTCTLAWNVTINNTMVWTAGLCFDMECNATIDVSVGYIVRQRRGRSHVWHDVNNAAATLGDLLHRRPVLWRGMWQYGGVESWSVENMLTRRWRQSIFRYVHVVGLALRCNSWILPITKIRPFFSANTL